MKTIYFDCGMGAAGDMLAAALLELIPDKDKIIDRINSLNIPGIKVSYKTSQKYGITGTEFSVKIFGKEENADNSSSYSCHEKHEYINVHTHEHTHEHNHEHTHEHTHEHDHEHTHSYDSRGHAHSHAGMHDIIQIVNGMTLPEKVKNDIIEVYTLIAEAESIAHGVPVTEIHFHEVGTMDAIADITSVCMLINEIQPDQIIVSPINVGSGHVHCAHGVLPVPAPATANILKNVPIYSGRIRDELCTPTGAALLKHFANFFGNMPVMRTEAIGCGMGKKDFDTANCVRAFIGEAEKEEETVVQLSCNLDDITPEEIAFASERFFEAGALDVYTVPAEMKKSRPGILLNVICAASDRNRMIELIFKYTTTLGIRESVKKRYTLSRATRNIMTPYGEIRQKVSTGYGTVRKKYEYEDIAKAARENNISLNDIIYNIENNNQK